MNILVPEIETFQMCPKTQNGKSVENGFKGFA
jgi:hypothetical protein